MSDAQADAGTAESQGPVQITEAVADRLAEKRADLFDESRFATNSPGMYSLRRENAPRMSTPRSRLNSTSGATFAISQHGRPIPPTHRISTTRSASKNTTRPTRCGSTSPT